VSLLPVEPCQSLPVARDPIFAAQGAAAVSYLPGHDLAEVEFAVAGRRTACSADEARHLLAALIEVFRAAATETSADPGR
jgi:hypothetical protein